MPIGSLKSDRHLIKQRPALSAFLSLFVCGLGEMINGSLSRGIVLSLSRVASIIMIPLLIIAKENNIAESMVILIFYAIIISIISPFMAYTISKNDNPLKPYNKKKYYILFAILSSLLTIISIYINISLYSFTIMTVDNISTELPKNTILILKKITIKDDIKIGSIFLCNNGKYGRAIALPNSTVKFSNENLFINGKKLPRTVYYDNIKFNNQNSYIPNKFNEVNNIHTYPIVIKNDKISKNISIHSNDNEIIMARDFRYGKDFLFNCKKEKLKYIIIDKIDTFKLKNFFQKNFN